MMSKVTAAILKISILVITASPSFAKPVVGAAPNGDPISVASKIIKHNFEQCKRVATAKRRQDGSIHAICNGTEYLVFTVFNPNQGKMLELAMNCTAAKNLMNITC